MTASETHLTAINGTKRPGRPTVPPSENAKALYRFLQEEWDRLGIAPTVWCRQNGLADPTVMRWQKGTEPDMRSLRRVAVALNRSILDVLVAAKYITPEEANGHVPQPIILDARIAIQNDDRIDQVLGETMLQLWDSWEEVITGAARKIETTVHGGRARTRRST